VETDNLSSSAHQAPETIYERYLAEAFSREKSNVENYDRSLLTLSAALLGLSATFVRDIAAPSDAVHLWTLYASWIALALTIIATSRSSSRPRPALLDEAPHAFADVRLMAWLSQVALMLFFDAFGGLIARGDESDPIRRKGAP
jgi:hypothetical protein